MPLDKALDALESLGRRAGLLKRKTVVFAPLDTIGHIHSLIRIANHLNQLGHRTVFLFMKPVDTKLKEMGHEVYDADTSDLVETVPDKVAKEDLLNAIMLMSKQWKEGDPIKALEDCFDQGLEFIINKIKNTHENLKKKMTLIKPDLIILDNLFGVPAINNHGNAPWVCIQSVSPLCLHSHPDLPQGWLGLPTRWDKQDERQRDWNERAIKSKRMIWDRYNEWYKSVTGSDLPSEPLSLFPLSPHLNIYMYPEELDYAPEFRLDKWQRCDCMVREVRAKKFDVPEKLRNKPGKLIFLSLGSLASADVELMQRVTSMLADLPHKFIVSKGPRGDAYELPDNMWGANLLPQLEILQSIDLIITHGGNNTITESFYYGVPGFIVCPLFGDQFDNAQRLQEKGLGLRLDPYNCTKEQLHEAIETMLNKPDVRDRMKAISERMHKPEARDKPLKLITEMLKKC